MLVLMAASPLAQAQSSAVLKWAEVDKPSINGEIIVAPSEVNRIAASHDVVYAVDTANSRLHRSYNGGLTFTDITSALSQSGAQLPAQEIAVAPDKPQYVAIVNNTRTKVYLSNDNGSTWTDTGLPTINGTIQCIAISNGYPVASTLVHDIAIGTADWGDTNTDGQIWVLQVGASFSGWQNQNLTISSHTGGEISAIAFSPGYNSDSTILAVASTADDAVPASNSTWLCIGQRDLSASTTLWNGDYIPGYPVPIGSLLGDDIGVTGIVSSIALPSDYGGMSSKPTDRKVLVSCDREPTNPLTALDNGIYRLDDATQQWQLLNNIAISSIAYFGTLQSGKLIAGDTTQVRRLFDPFYATPPPISWQTANQPPSGPGNAQLAWSNDGTVAFCGTGQIPGIDLDESAFSQSLDNGNTWVQTSLINTVIHISDIAPAPDSKSLFMATYSGVGPEGVWRAAGEPLGTYWSRLLTMETISDRLILRLSPDYADDYTLYVAEVNSGSSSSLMAVSHNRGNTWQKIYGPPHIIDVAVEDKDTIYVALPGGYLRRNTTNGAAWLSPPVSCFPDTASEINMLTVVGKGNILVGSRDSSVAYSTDNGRSFTEIDRPISSHAGDVQVVADADYSKNKIIYATDKITDDGIWRWTIGTSTEWEQIDEPVTQLETGQRICGLGMGKEGTLYALRAEPVAQLADNIRSGGMDRSLNPSQPYVWNIEFDVLNRTLPVGTIFDPTTIDTTIIPNVPIFPNTMPSLKLASDVNQNVAWAVDFANMLIYRFDDNICKVGPVINSPDTVGCDPVSGKNHEVNIDWEQLSLSNQYEIQIAKDDQFSIQVVENEHIIPVDLMAPAVFFPAGGIVPTSASEIANWGNFECGHKYYWRTRTRRATTGEIIRSPWSEIGSFTVKAGLPVEADYYGPKLLSPDNGCLGCPIQPASFSWSSFKETTKYEFVLAKDAAMTQVVVDDEAYTSAYQYEGMLDYGTGYYWRVIALEPVPSDWSATFVFQTETAPALPSPPAKAPGTPLWVWVLMAVGSIFVLVTVFLIFRVR
jgi:hypothetical protein